MIRGISGGQRKRVTTGRVGFRFYQNVDAEVYVSDRSAPIFIKFTINVVKGNQINMESLPALLLTAPPCSIQSSLPKLFPPLENKNRCQPKCLQYVATAQTSVVVEDSRRSGNYQPSIWHYDFIQSLQSDYKNGKPYADRVEELKREAQCLLRVTTEDPPLAKLELIDHLQRLGIAYMFEWEIKNTLETIFVHNAGESDDDLYATSLRFRLLRQHGYKVTPTDAFSRFMQTNTSFKEELCGDVRGILSLYEASELGYEGEGIMEEAKAFSSTQLNAMMGQLDPKLAEKVGHSLELPLHRRMLRLEARWYIDVYAEEEDMNPALLELAKLDFNMVQAIHQRDLRKTSRWWRELGLGEELSFARSRLMECFFWTVGMAFDPQFIKFREGLTKVNQFITTIDDIYDVYGSLDELEIFTDAVDRWDLKAMDQLPDYMKICFLALYNTTNEFAYDTLKEQGLDITPYLKKAWADLCKAYLVEAKWYNSGYKPTLEEYLENGWISISGPLMLVHSFFLARQEITKEALQCLENYPKIIQYSSMILRLCDDLGTSTAELERGDVPKCIQCYMNEAGVSEEIAREHIRGLIIETWKKMNEECVTCSSHFPQPFINICVNLGRMAQCMYQYGDGHGAPDNVAKDRIMRLLVEPIQFKEC